MLGNKIKKKLRIRSEQELSKQMEGLIQLKKVLDQTLDKWFLSGGLSLVLIEIVILFHGIGMWR